MGWFNKKKEDEDIPRLPELPELPDLPESLSSPSELPAESLPNVPPGLPEIESRSLIVPTEKELELPELPYDGTPDFEKEAIKQEINDPQVSLGYTQLPSLARVPATRMMNTPTRISPPKIMPVSTRTFKPSMIERRIEPDFDLEPKRTLELSPSRMSVASTKKIEPVFVRLDKFQMTLQTFEEIKAKIEEIEEVLRKTSEIKVKEEQELSEWEREIQVIRSRIELIDRNVFNKLD
jgi:hypothetical protein